MSNQRVVAVTQKMEGSTSIPFLPKLLPLISCAVRILGIQCYYSSILGYAAFTSLILGYHKLVFMLYGGLFVVPGRRAGFSRPICTLLSDLHSHMLALVNLP